MNNYQKALAIYNRAVATMYKISATITILPPTIFVILALVFAGVVPIGQFIFVTGIAIVGGFLYARYNKPTPPTPPTEE